MTQQLKLNSLEALKNIDFKAPPALSTKVEGKTGKKKAGYTYKKAAPVYTKRLAEKLGSMEQVAREIGCTGVTVSAGVRANAIAAPIEKAAEGIWKTEHEPKVLDRAPLSKTERLVVMCLSTNDLKVMEEWLTTNNVSFSVLS